MQPALALCVVGIVGSLMVYGLLQERIMTQPFGAEGEVFKHSLFLVLCNRLFTCVTAVIVLLGTPRQTSSQHALSPGAPVFKYALISLSNVASSTCQYEALKYVSFPVQTIGKCAKMIPVMIWSTFMVHKQYHYTDYLIAAFVTGGSTLFLLAGNVASPVQYLSGYSSFDSTLLGAILMLAYLGCDGFTSTFQDSLFKGYHTDVFNQVLYTSACSSAISLVGGVMLCWWGYALVTTCFAFLLRPLFAPGLVFSGTLLPSFVFVTRHPMFIHYVVALSLAATLGQVFITYTISSLGALTFAAIMTTRQLLSIVLSCVWFLHPLAPQQWLGAGVVLVALNAKAFARKREKKGASSGMSISLANATPARDKSHLSDPNTPASGAEQSTPLISPAGVSHRAVKDGDIEMGTSVKSPLLAPGSISHRQAKEIDMELSTNLK
eukprot:jgi/Chlat1/4233/Chrsp27S04249